LTLPGASGSAAESHNRFSAYLARTKNTICGRHPIGVLFGALTQLEKPGEESNVAGSRAPVVKWVTYAQSSKCFNINDSSVSYASAYVVF
jgi:MEMO1 family protein